MRARPICVGIGGGSGSGKSWLAHFLKDRLGKRAVVVCQDWYYRDNGGLSARDSLELNFDHPRAFELPLLVAHLQELLAGRPVRAPRYDYARHARLPEFRFVEPASVVLIEGLLVLHERRLRRLMDLSVFIDVPSDVRLLRRVRRDHQERRVDLEETLRLYEHCVRPMHERYIGPSAAHATWVWRPLGDRRFPAKLLRAIEGYRLTRRSTRCSEAGAAAASMRILSAAKSSSSAR